MKDLIDKVGAKEPEQRCKWYNQRVAIMLTDLKQKAPHTIVKKAHAVK